MNLASGDQSQVLQKLVDRSKWQYFSKLYEKNNLNTQILQLLILIHIIFDPLFEYFQVDAIGYIKQFNSFETLIFSIKNQQVKEIDSDRMLVARSYVLKIFTNKKERFLQIDEDLDKLCHRLYLISINVIKVSNNSTVVKETKNDQNYYSFEKRYDEAIQQFYYVPVYSVKEEPNGLKKSNTKCLEDIISKIDKAAEMIRQGKQEQRVPNEEVYQSSQSEEEQVHREPLISVFTVETIDPSENEPTQKNRLDFRRQTLVDRVDDGDQDLEIRRVSVGNIVKNNHHNIVDLSMVSQKSSKSFGKFITRFSAKRYITGLKKQVDSKYNNIKQQTNHRTNSDSLMESEDSSPNLKNQVSLMEVSPRDTNQTLLSQTISLPMERSSQSFTSFLRKSVVNDRKSILYVTPKNTPEIRTSDQQQFRMSIIQKYQTPLSNTPKLEIKEVQSDDVSCVESNTAGNNQVITTSSQNISSSDESDSEEIIAISQSKQDKELELNDQYMISITNMDNKVVQQEKFNQDEYGEALAMLKQFHQLQDQGLQIKQTQRSTRLSILPCFDNQDKKQPNFQFNTSKTNTQNINPKGVSPTPSVKVPPAALTNIYIAPKIQAIQSELFDMIRDSQVAEPINKIHPKKLMLNSLTWIKQGSRVYK